jgi:GNAT superfamily N-acetyltransferase
MIPLPCPVGPSNMSEETFHNASWRVVAVLLWLCVVLVVVAGVPVGVVKLISLRKPVSSDLWAACLIPALILGSMALGMLLSALLTIPTARATDRIFDTFRSGALLARWDYPAAMWEGHVAAEARRSRRNARIWVGIAFVLIGGVAGLISYSVPAARSRKIGAACIAVAATVLAAAGVYRLVVMLMERRLKAKRDCPRAYIGPTAVYAGGTFNFWGSQLRALQSVKLEAGQSPGQPERIVVVIGLSKAIGRMTRVVDMATTAAMRPTRVSSYTVRQEILVPPGEEARAREVVTKLRESI